MMPKSEESSSGSQSKDEMSDPSRNDLKIRRMHPSQCNKIETGLYLGGLDAAEQLETLRHLRITHVLTVASFPVRRSASDDIQSLFIDAEDWEDENLLASFPKAISFIQEGQQRGNCLVHCLAGISRSAALVIAFLMQKYGISFQEAFDRVEEKRPCISPNLGFESQLKLFEAMRCTIDTENMGYKVFALHHLAKKVKDKNFDSIHNFIEEFKGNTLRGNQYKCKKCRPEGVKGVRTERPDGKVSERKDQMERQYLFSEGNVIHHIQGRPLAGTDPELQSLDAHQSSICKNSILIEPLSWMSEIFRSMEGKLYCPKCEEKLGSFLWEDGDCICGAYVSPQFRISESKVDAEQNVQV